MIKKNLKEKLIYYFRKFFGLKNTPLLTEGNLEKNKSKEQIKKELIGDISEKKITMYLYNQIYLGNLETKYIPDKYLHKIKRLLEEENKIKKNKIKQLKEQIQNIEYLINNNG